MNDKHTILDTLLHPGIEDDVEEEEDGGEDR